MSSPLHPWPTSKPRAGDLQRHLQRLSRLLYAISTSLFGEAPFNGLTEQSASEPYCEGAGPRLFISRWWFISWAFMGAIEESPRVHTRIERSSSG
jgi:hypothetical protein